MRRPPFHSLGRGVLNPRPRQGQANHFNRYVKEPNPYSLERYQTEVKRLYGVLDKHLADKKSSYLVGEKCTIADIAHWGWIVSASTQP